ncbi:bifunctional acetate--CoA ligase family protein/GNAT family N-acetyltransferase [Amycolatopsis aidingensis]|uniref:bifunctional acetate--CoA ligase family protein/GNAT family N-acetyltransferase n=1 Tax=Amycolatopsis aidingensis TaxID=2842453 RepID=UPI001C0C80AD|nr:GNAT family N-acetyltransferase [Amycolatopsis aidingensis]
MPTAPDQGRHSLLTDGRVVLVRPLAAADAPEVLRLHQRLDERDSYFRFFGPLPRQLPELASRIATAAGSRHASAGAFLAGRLIGVAGYEGTTDPGACELALVVEGAAQAGGVGTLLLEHLVSVAREHGVRRLEAAVLAENTGIIRVLRDLGLPLLLTGSGPERSVELDLTIGDGYREAMAARERVATTASLRRVLAPRSVAVIGAARRPGAVGHAVLRNLLDAGFTGQLSPVNPHAERVLGLPCVATVGAVRPVPELAVVCLPAPAVPDAVEQCGLAGVAAVVVVSAGLTVADGRRVRESARRHGMRLVGPNCIGVANTDPGVRLNATFLRTAPPGGDIGVVTQSGGVAIALACQLGSAGLGVSTLVSTGDKYDLSGNDLLLWWQRDPRTAAAVLYLESFGNPRKFSRFAREFARHKPLLAVRAGSTPVAQRAAASHTAAAATPAVTRDALFEQAGVLAVDSVSELLAVLAAARWQPLPRGNRVAVLSNAGGTGVLAADACARHGLVLPELGAETVARLRSLLPAQASAGNPVDTSAGAGPAAFAAAARVLAEDEAVDVVLAATLPTALGDPGAELASIAGLGKPVLAVRPAQPEHLVAVRDADGAPVTAGYADPEQAAAAIGALARYADWRGLQELPRPEFPDLDLTGARRLVEGALACLPAGGWLEPPAVTELLRCFGIPVVPTAFAADEDSALAVRERFGGPVAVKAVAEGVLHKSKAGGVVLDVADAAELRAAWKGLVDRFGPALRGVVVQPMAPRGRELLAGISADDVFGPLLVFGLGGVDTDLVADRAARLAPLTAGEADRLLRGLRCSAALHAEGVLTKALREVLLRVGTLAELVPEVAELDLNPLVATPDGVVALDARVRVHRPEVTDPYLRYLRA